MHDLEAAIEGRRSVRGFVPDRPVPRALIEESLALAQRAPSNCNVQPWRVYLASGGRLARLRGALGAAISGGEPPSPEDEVDSFPAPYRRLQVDCAVALYEQMGIERQDAGGRARAMLRNFEFFDAPHVAMVCMQKYFGLGVALDVGMYVQTLMLGLWARGVASCAQASLRQYPQVIRRELEIPDDLRVMCAVSFGYEDETVPANRTRQTREAWTSNVVLLDD